MTSSDSVAGRDRPGDEAYAGRDRPGYEGFAGRDCSGDEGYFPRGSSLLRRVMRERAVNLLYGQRALMIGALQPVAFIGTTQRSTAHQRPWKRLVHTAEMFDAVFFGTREEADKALEFTQRLHQRVNGTIGVQAGPYGPDTRYDALDPELGAAGASRVRRPCTVGEALARAGAGAHPSRVERRGIPAAVADRAQACACRQAVVRASGMTSTKRPVRPYGGVSAEQRVAERRV